MRFWRRDPSCVETLRAAAGEAPDPLLSLEDEMVELRYVLMDLGRELFRSTLMSQAPLAIHRFERMSHPQVGDYVVEMSRGRLKRAEDAYREFGRVLTVGAILGDGYRIQYGPALEDVVTWENCSFVAIPISGASWWRDPPGLTTDRQTPQEETPQGEPRLGDPQWRGPLQRMAERNRRALTGDDLLDRQIARAEHVEKQEEADHA